MPAEVASPAYIVPKAIAHADYFTFIIELWNWVAARPLESPEELRQRRVTLSRKVDRLLHPSLDGGRRLINCACPARGDVPLKLLTLAQEAAKLHAAETFPRDLVAREESREAELLFEFTRHFLPQVALEGIRDQSAVEADARDDDMKVIMVVGVRMRDDRVDSVLEVDFPARFLAVSLRQFLK